MKKSVSSKKVVASKKSNKKSIKMLIGKKFFFRLATYHQVGKVVSNPFGMFLELENASWVADSGRFMQAIQNGELNELEPVGKSFINIDTCIDFFPWNHELPTFQK